MKLYLIGGKARQGKDTTGTLIKEYYEQNGEKVCILQVSNYLKHFAKDYFGWDGSEDTKPRALLNELGDLIRHDMNKPLFFINRIKEDMEVLSHYYDVAIITDIRLPIEFEEMSKLSDDVVKLYITRPDLNTPLNKIDQSHLTETALDGYDQYDIKLINTSLEQLKLDVIEMIEKRNM